MKIFNKTSVAAALGAGAIAFSSMGMAETNGSTQAHVFVDVDPNITVGVVTGNVNLGTVQTGSVLGSLVFRVDSNVETARIQVDATKLYKGNDPTDTAVMPIELDLAVPATYMIADGNPTNGLTNDATCAVAPGTFPTAKGDMEGYNCAEIEFESSQNGHFSQDVTVELTWDQSDPELTVGQYSGYVFFNAAIL